MSISQASEHSPYLISVSDSQASEFAQRGAGLLDNNYLAGRGERSIPQLSGSTGRDIKGAYFCQLSVVRIGRDCKGSPVGGGVVGGLD
jgi:hypothetical protein